MLTRLINATALHKIEKGATYGTQKEPENTNYRLLMGSIWDLELVVGNCRRLGRRMLQEHDVQS